MRQQVSGDAPPHDYDRWKVLIVEDVQDLRDALRELLEEEGYDTLQAADGRAALDILRRSRFPIVVLLDMMMPMMGGDSVIETLIKERALAKHAIILITASPSTVPRSVRSVLAKFEIPIICNTVPPDELIEQVELASARITLQQNQPL